MQTAADEREWAGRCTAALPAVAVSAPMGEGLPAVTLLYAAGGVVDGPPPRTVALYAAAVCHSFRGLALPGTAAERGRAGCGRTARRAGLSIVTVAPPEWIRAYCCNC